MLSSSSGTRRSQRKASCLKKFSVPKCSDDDKKKEKRKKVWCNNDGALNGSTCFMMCRQYGQVFESYGKVLSITR